MALDLFSHGFQVAFTFKTVFKALDSDLHFVHGATRPLLCARDRVQPLAPWQEYNNHMIYSGSYNKLFCSMQV